MDISQINLRTYSKPLEVRKYARLAGLSPAETAILHRLRPRIEGRRILDLGVGGGRTTADLLAVSRDYVGLDYAAPMVERCRERFPGVDFQVCDARDLSRFPDGSFDFVLFSFNGLDYLDHEGRLKALAEIRRVLAPGGAFAFSSHNRNAPQTPAWSLSHLPGLRGLATDPLGSAKRIAKFALGLRNRLSNRAHEREGPGYAVVNEEGASYGLMSYVITVEGQLRQLADAGFGSAEAVGLDGAWLGPDGRDRTDPWIYYLCRRA